MKSSLITAITLAGLAIAVNAATIGAGVEILQLGGANIQVDTSSTGSNDQSRQNLDETFFVTLSAGIYAATSWQYNAGQAGSVTPYLAILTGTNAYEIIAVGDTRTITDGFNEDITVPFSASTTTFTLGASTDVYAGIVNPKEIGSQNPVRTNLASGSTVDHDNNADGNMSPGVLGGTVTGFGHANLSRSYAFSIDVQKVPEPTSALLLSGLVATFLLGARRR